MECDFFDNHTLRRWWKKNNVENGRPDYLTGLLDVQACIAQLYLGSWHKYKVTKTIHVFARCVREVEMPVCHQGFCCLLGTYLIVIIELLMWDPDTRPRGSCEVPYVQCKICPRSISSIIKTIKTFGLIHFVNLICIRNTIKKKRGSCHTHKFDGFDTKPKTFIIARNVKKRHA